MTKDEQQRNQLILAQLEKTYGQAGPELEYQTIFQLLSAVILSAQCTDKQVNQVTQRLFLVAPDAQSMSKLRVSEIEELIRGVGLFRNKAKNLSIMSQQLVTDFQGEVPNKREALEELPGVGRKTASVVLAVAFQQPALAVDTHVFRVSNRMGLAKAKNPYETEMQLCDQIPRDKWADAHHWFIHHGRYCCKSKKPQCEACPVEELCPKIFDWGKGDSTDG
jgi:endonuclease-3